MSLVKFVKLNRWFLLTLLIFKDNFYFFKHIKVYVRQPSQHEDKNE